MVFICNLPDVPKMKKILFLTYYYPPSSGAGVQRPLKLSKNLHQFGVDPVVISVDPDVASYAGFDHHLLEEVPPSLRVYRTNTNEHYKYYRNLVRKNIPTAGFANESNPGFLQRLARFIRGNFYFPDPRKGWNDYAFEQAKKLIREEKIDTVFTTSPPHSTHLIGQRLKKELGVRWICDLIDPWTDIYYFKQLYHLPYALRINRRMEREVLEQADALITCSYNFRNLFLTKTPKIKAEDFKILYYGYDKKNFEALASRPSSSEFIITYTGTIADIYYPQSLFRAIKKITETTDVPVKLRFVGMASKGIQDFIKEAGIGHITEFTGLVPHNDSLNYLMKATVLLLIVPKNENNEGIIPGKIFEYFASRKPIIALANPKGDVAQLVTDNAFGMSFAHEEEQAMFDYLAELLKKWKEDPNLDLPVQDLHRFESTYQAELLANIVLKK
jgi:glycosyltransferase involved in cell wall biosynthesis